MMALDLLAIFVFGVAGGLTAVRMRLDIVGVAVLGTVSGIGGGMMRDVLIGALPSPLLSDWRYLCAPLVGGLLTFWFHPAIGRLQGAINIADAFGLGLFTVAGAVKATEHGLGPVPATLLGVMTGVGGGVLRDVLTRQVPELLRAGTQLYATTALAGAALTVAAMRLDAPTVAVVLVGVTATTGFRLLTIWRGWTAPSPVLPGLPPAD